LVLIQALRHQRHLPFLSILFAYWLPLHLQSAIDRVWHWRRKHSGDWSSALAPLTSGLLILLCGIFALQLGRRLTDVPVRRDDYPVAAVQFMADQSLTGRMIVSAHWAQYVLGVIGSRFPGEGGVLVACDGRCRTCYPQEVFDLQFDFFIGAAPGVQRFRSPHSPPADPKRILSYADPQLVLLNQCQQHAMDVMQAQADQWVLLYQDQLSQLWGRRSVYDDPAQATYFHPSRRQVTRTPQMGIVSWPAAPRRMTRSETVPVNATSRRVFLSREDAQ
jgi:hypothetical protein